LRTLLIRHAQTVWNASSRIQGQADPELSELGRDQVRRLGERMAGTPLAAIHTSDLARARETADAVAATAATGVTPIHDSRLREVDLGQWEGATNTELQARYPELYQEWLRNPTWDLVPGGEGEAALETRVFAAMGDILGAAAETDTVAVVTHIGVIRLLLAAVAGTSRNNLRWRWAIHNTSITAVDSRADFDSWPRGEVELVAINDSIQHLAQAA
jgi:probable phosphoglycerate mutase